LSFSLKRKASRKLVLSFSLKRKASRKLVLSFGQIRIKSCHFIFYTLFNFGIKIMFKFAPSIV
jgi:hypothetical protein